MQIATYTTQLQQFIVCPDFFIILCELNWDGNFNGCELIWDVTVIKNFVGYHFMSSVEK